MYVIENKQNLWSWTTAYRFFSFYLQWFAIQYIWFLCACSVCFWHFFLNRSHLSKLSQRHRVPPTRTPRQLQAHSLLLDTQSKGWHTLASSQAERAKRNVVQDENKCSDLSHFSVMFTLEVGNMTRWYNRLYYIFYTGGSYCFSGCILGNRRGGYKSLRRTNVWQYWIFSFLFFLNFVYSVTILDFYMIFCIHVLKYFELLEFDLLEKQTFLCGYFIC